MYCKICHKSKPENHFDLYPDHNVATKRPLSAGPEDKQGETPKDAHQAPRSSAARPPRQAPQSPRVAASRSSQSDQEEFKEGVTILAIGAAIFGGIIGLAMWLGGRNGGAA